MAYHLAIFRVPQVVRVPQFENPCNRSNELKCCILCIFMMQKTQQENHKVVGVNDHLLGIVVSMSDCHPRGPGFDSRLYPRNF